MFFSPLSPLCALARLPAAPALFFCQRLAQALTLLPSYPLTLPLSPARAQSSGREHERSTALTKRHSRHEPDPQQEAQEEARWRPRRGGRCLQGQADGWCVAFLLLPLSSSFSFAATWRGVACLRLPRFRIRFFPQPALSCRAACLVGVTRHEVTAEQGWGLQMDMPQGTRKLTGFFFYRQEGARGHGIAGQGQGPHEHGPAGHQEVWQEISGFAPLRTTNEQGYRRTDRQIPHGIRSWGLGQMRNII
jgi:hypothetical protein